MGFLAGSNSMGSGARRTPSAVAGSQRALRCVAHTLAKVCVHPCSCSFSTGLQQYQQGRARRHEALLVVCGRSGWRTHAHNHAAAATKQVVTESVLVTCLAR